MTEILIKSQYHDTVIAFNNSGVVLKDRSRQDLIDLAIMAHQSGNPNLLVLFENLPSLDELKAMKLRVIEQQVMKTQPAVQKPDNKNSRRKDARSKKSNKKESKTAE